MREGYEYTWSATSYALNEYLRRGEMKLTKEIVEWLQGSAYAVKGGEYWFLSDFPDDQIPERLEIPINKRMWEKWNQPKEVSK